MKKIINPLSIDGKDYHHKVRLFDQPFYEAEMPLSLERSMDSLDHLMQRDAARYKGLIPDNFGWKEKVLLCYNQGVSLEDIGIRPLPLQTGTSYQLTAWRKDPDNQFGVNPGYVVSVHGITITSDEYLVFGRRGGNSTTAGQGEAAPGGNVSDEGKDPLFTTYFNESIEELDIDANHLIDPKIVAVQNDHHFRPTINFIFAAHTTYSFAEVEERHYQAMLPVLEARANGKPTIHAEAREATMNAGLRNIDAWEKDYLVAIPLKKNTIEECINSRTIPGKDETLNLLSSSLGDLQVAVELLKRNEF